MSTARLGGVWSAAVLVALHGVAGCGPAGEPDAGEPEPSCVSGCPDGLCDVGEWVPVCPGTYVVRGEVTLTRGFEILSTEVTQGEFAEMMGYNPSRFSVEGDRFWPSGVADQPACGPDCPVEGVTWAEALQYCNGLSELEGLAPCYVCTGVEDEARCELAPGYETPYECEGYRLPTVAEWVCAARAGTTWDTYVGDLVRGIRGCEPYPPLREIAWYCGVAPHPVGELRPNPWGLYDVIGNVAEWAADYICTSFDPMDCEGTGPSEEPATDPYDALDVDFDARSVRSCGWGSEIQECVVLSGAAGLQNSRDVNWGFRPARTRLDIVAEVEE